MTTMRVLLPSVITLEVRGHFRGDRRWSAVTTKLAHARRGGVNRLILDLREMTSIDFAGLVLLRELTEAWKQGGGILAACGPGPRLTSGIAIFRLPESVGELSSSPEEVLDSWLHGGRTAA